jgi:hypothetical protein
MKKVLKHNFETGSKESKEPRLFGSIVKELLHGNSPLAVGYRQYIASQEKGKIEEQGWNRNTHLCVDLKTQLISDRSMKAGKGYLGVLRRDEICEEFRYMEHFTFVETMPQTACKRNPRVFDGMFITATRQSDGELRLNFKRLLVDEDFCPECYALGVYNEICVALEGLIEK